MAELKERFLNFRYKGIICITLVFLLIAFILFLERSGIQANYRNMSLPLLPAKEVLTKDEAYKSQPKDTLVLINSQVENSVNAFEEFRQVFVDMKIGYDLADVSFENDYDFNKYEAVVLAISDITPMGEKIISLCDWVKNGGSAMFAMTLEKSPYTAVIESKLGIADSSYYNTVVDSIYVEEDFMIGGGRGFTFTDPYDSGWAVQLDMTDVTLHAYTNDERKLPLIWEKKYGDGKFVVDNIGYYDKAMRGFYAASYSLLSDVCAYPVINGSVFYLDDFPSQIPSGSSEYITRDFGTSIRDFYVNIWWPDMMNVADKYKLRYTGLAIECYDDNVDGSTPALPDKGTFLNFGNMLLRQGGEIGYHGYNHQPLCLGDHDYKGVFDYKTWDSTEAMEKAFTELTDLCDELFPDVDMQIYVPPSNIFSIDGRKMLAKEFPQIKTVSGIYFHDSDSPYSWTQEFDVADDGIVEQPRVVSGCELNPYMELAVISELNLHFANSHFTHPDDALDPERGAEHGWEHLRTHFTKYLDWLYTSAPTLRNFTGSEMSAAVQRFSSVTVDRKITDKKMVLKLGNFHDEAQLLVRFNEKKPNFVLGGSLTHITGDLYLLHANKDTVTVTFK